MRAPAGQLEAGRTLRGPRLAPSLPRAEPAEERQRRRSGRRPRCGHRRPVARSTGMSSTSAPIRRGVSDAWAGAAKTLLRQVGQRASARQRRTHAGAPTASANRARGSVRQASSRSPAAEQRRDAAAVVLAADLGADRLAARRMRTVADPRDRHLLGRAGHEVHLDAMRLAARRTPDARTPSGSKSAPSSWLSTRSMLRLNSAVTPRRSL